MKPDLRTAIDSDLPAIANLLQAAFGDKEGPVIAELVAHLLADPTARPLLSLVATTGEQVIGHILFTRANIQPVPQEVSASILAPLAIHPQHQKQGLGSRLIQAGIRQLKTDGTDLVFVLGHPGYYPKYGFSPAGEKGLEAPYPILPKNAGAWMVQELGPGVIGRVHGRVNCASALDDPKYWQE